MIEQGTYHQVRNGVCAVGYLLEPLETYTNNPQSEIFQVLGTGFLVEPELVMTNRHVIGALLEAEVTHTIPRTQFFVQFVAPGQDQTLRIVPRMIRTVSYLDDLDIGFVRYQTVFPDHFDTIQPLAIGEEWNLQVSEEIAVCGYPYGTSLLAIGTLFRWGSGCSTRSHISCLSLRYDGGS